MKTQVLIHPRAEELLVERALRPLDDSEAAELAALGAADDDSLDLAAAAIAIAETPYEDMPAELLERMAEPTAVSAAPVLDFRTTLAGVVMAPSASGRAIAVATPSAPVAAVVPIAAARERKQRRVSVGWVVAAAAAGIALAVGAGLWQRSAGRGRAVAQAQPAPAEARAQLMASATDAKPRAWTATADVAATGASGDVVWSAQQQRGYMRFVGLATNDPTAWQYQLWIFDRARDQAFPVDGGVFDVSSTGEVIVPISARLRVDDATLFAVTVERPGGVVVSKRERIVVTAKAS